LRCGIKLNEGDKTGDEWSNLRVVKSEVNAMALEGHIRELTDKHKKLQEQIDAEMAHSGWDEMRIAALKKEKLRLKDELERLRGQGH
jgi:hypothetical protein